MKSNFLSILLSLFCFIGCKQCGSQVEVSEIVQETKSDKEGFFIEDSSHTLLPAGITGISILGLGAGVAVWLLLEPKEVQALRKRVEVYLAKRPSDRLEIERNKLIKDYKALYSTLPPLSKKAWHQKMQKLPLGVGKNRLWFEQKRYGLARNSELEDTYLFGPESGYGLLGDVSQQRFYQYENDNQRSGPKASEDETKKSSKPTIKEFLQSIATYSRVDCFANTKDGYGFERIRLMVSCYLTNLLALEELEAKFPKLSRERLNQEKNNILRRLEKTDKLMRGSDHPFSALFEDIKKQEGVFAFNYPRHAMMLVLDSAHQHYWFFDPNYGLYQFPDAHTLSEEIKNFLHMKGYFEKGEKPFEKNVALNWSKYYRLGPIQLRFLLEEEDTGFDTGLCAAAVAQAARWFLEHPGQIPTREQLGFVGLSDETWMDEVVLRGNNSNNIKKMDEIHLFRKFLQTKKVLYLLDSQAYAEHSTFWVTPIYLKSL